MRVMVLCVGLAFCGMLAARQTDQPPIRVTIMVHIEDVTGNNLWNRPVWRESDDPTEDAFRERCDNLARMLHWALQFPERKRPKFLIQFNGDFAERLLASESKEAVKLMGQLKEAWRAGLISLGTHTHGVTKRGGRWQPLPSPTPSVCPWRQPNKLKDWDADIAVGALRAHIEAVDRLIREITGRDPKSVNTTIVGAFGGTFAGRAKLYSAKLRDSTERTLQHPFLAETGGERSEGFLALFGHQMWQPFRAGDNFAKEDRKAAIVFLPFSGTVGTAGSHMRGWDYTDSSTPALKRQFVHLYLERLWHKTRNLPPKIWVFGFSIHPYNLYPDSVRDGVGLRTLRQSIKEIVNWLNRNFIGRKDAQGNLIAEWATADEVLAAFREWERRNPNRSSFNYPANKTDWRLYPYKLKGLAFWAANSHFVALRDEAGVKCCVLRCLPTTIRGEENWLWMKKGKRLVPKPAKNARPRRRYTPTFEIRIYWHDSAAEKVRPSAFQNPNEILIDAVTGKPITTKKLTLSQRPILAIPQRLYKPPIPQYTLTLSPKKNLGRFKPLNGVYGSGYSPKSHFPHISDALKDCHCQFIRFPQDDGFRFTLATIFPNIKAAADSPRSYNFAPLDEYLREAAKTGAAAVWTALYDIGGGDHWAPPAFFQAGRPPRNPKKWAQVVKHIVMHINDNWGGPSPRRIQFVECYNEPMGLGGCNPKQYFRLYAEFAKALSDFNANTKHPVKLLGFGEPVHLGPSSPKRDPSKISLAKEFIQHILKNQLQLDALAIHPYASSPYHIYLLVRRYRKMLQKQELPNLPLALTEYGSIFSHTKRDEAAESVSYKLAAFQTAVKIWIQNLGVCLATGARAAPSAIPNRPKRNWTPFFKKDKTPLPAALTMKILSQLSKQTPVICDTTQPDANCFAAVALRSKNSVSFSIIASNFSKQKRYLTLNVPQNRIITFASEVQFKDGKIVMTSITPETLRKPLTVKPYRLRIIVLRLR